MCTPDLFSKIKKLFIFWQLQEFSAQLMPTLPILHRLALCTRLLFTVHASPVVGKVLILYTVSKRIGSQGPLPNSCGYIISKRYNAHLGYIALERHTVNLHLFYTMVERLTVHLSYIATEMYCAANLYSNI